METSIVIFFKIGFINFMGVMGHKLVLVFECFLTIFGMVTLFIINYSLGFIDIVITISLLFKPYVL